MASVFEKIDPKRGSTPYPKKDGFFKSFVKGTISKARETIKDEFAFQKEVRTAKKDAFRSERLEVAKKQGRTRARSGETARKERLALAKRQGTQQARGGGFSGGGFSFGNQLRNDLLGIQPKAVRKKGKSQGVPRARRKKASCIMPFTPQFNKIRRRFKNQYDDDAKADTFAFMKAFELKVPTFQSRRRRFKKQGQAIVSGFLFFFMAIICVALFMPIVIQVITNSTPGIEAGTHGNFISLMITFWPVYLVIMLFVILIILMRR